MLFFSGNQRIQEDAAFTAIEPQELDIEKETLLGLTNIEPTWDPTRILSGSKKKFTYPGPRIKYLRPTRTYVGSLVVEIYFRPT